MKKRISLSGILVALMMLGQSAQASIFEGEALDTVANVISWAALVIAPVTAIVVFWLVHIMPEKIAEKKNHPQAKAIQVLCLLSLAFGGLLWPLAWLWAYSKPVLYKMAYGTDIVEHEPIEHEKAADTYASGPATTTELESLRIKVAALEAQLALPKINQELSSQMELILLLIYSFFVWLIFFKFKWLPWTIVSQVIVITLPIIGLAVLILLLNIAAPSTADVRVINYVVQIVPRVTGRVIELPVDPNRLVKKGAVLFRIDPTPFKNEAAAAQARLVEARAKLREGGARLSDASAGARELRENLKAATGQVGAVSAKIELARKRLEQNRELFATGAGNKFDLERAETDLKELQAQLDSAGAAEAQVVQKLSAQVDGDLAQVASAKAQLAAASAQIASAEAQLADANWKLSETTVYAPTDGYAINLQLRVGSTASQFAGFPVMSFVENEQWIIALYTQNELRKIEPGNEAEIALRTYPNRIIKCKVDSIVWATGTGQLPFGASLAQPGSPPMLNKYVVKLTPDDEDKDLFLAAGAVGNGAVYTNSMHMIHIIRKVVIRVGTKLDWLILKLH